MATRGEGTTTCVGNRGNALKRECPREGGRHRPRAGRLLPASASASASASWAAVDAWAAAATPRHAPARPCKRGRCRAQSVRSAGSGPWLTLLPDGGSRALGGHPVLVQDLAELLDLLGLGLLALLPLLLGRANLRNRDLAPDLHGHRPHRDVDGNAPQQRAGGNVDEFGAALPREVGGQAEGGEPRVALQDVDLMLGARVVGDRDVRPHGALLHLLVLLLLLRLLLGGHQRSLTICRERRSRAKTQRMSR